MDKSRRRIIQPATRSLPSSLIEGVNGQKTTPLQRRPTRYSNTYSSTLHSNHPSAPHDRSTGLPTAPRLLMETPFLLLVPLLPFLLTNVSAATVAISHGSSTVCAIGTQNNIQTVTCSRPNLPNFLIKLPFSFSSISGGRDYLCGIRSSASAIFCWNHLTAQNISSSPVEQRRIFKSKSPDKNASELAVGEDHVAGVLGGREVVFWRDKRKFPSSVEGEFESLTSGKRFTCGIEKNSSLVRCWGSNSDAVAKIQKDLANEAMRSISAGYSMVCGVNTTGALVCSDRKRPSVSSPSEFSSPAVGKTHLCALRANRSAVCWKGNYQRSYGPVGLGNKTFEFLVAGGNLTCGLVSINLSVVCWGLDGSLLDLNLPRALPGPCVDVESHCECGTVADSARLCGTTGSSKICKPCDSPPPPPSPPPSPPPPPESHGGNGNSNSNSVKNKLLLAFGIVGSSAGLCSIVYCAWVGLFRRKKRVHNSVLPTVASGSVRRATSSPPAPPTNSFISSVASFKSRSAASSLFGRRIQRQRSGPSSAKVPDRAEEFTLLELSLATDGFSPSARIGSGSFGSVYRGTLPDGREVAVKRSEPGSRPTRVGEKDSEFQSELAFLSRLHHKHLVALIGFCEDGDERLLVYEYMSNGSLYDHLHPKVDVTPSSSTSASTSTFHASWRLRIKLLVDGARGIEYLHNYAVPPIIHRDIKSSNILIDGTWTARISDFGLSLDDGSTETSEGGGPAANYKKAGTVGYMDPEYYGLHQPTTKSDVYGFGVVMLEVLTGRKAIFKVEGGGGGLTNVVDYAWGSVVEGEVRRVLDRRVVADGTEAEAEAVERVAYTAVRCVSLVGAERPTMRDVVSNLEAALALCDEAASDGTSLDEEEE